MSPKYAIDIAWIVWAISWFAAASWSSRIQVRAAGAGVMAYRLLVLAGVILIFQIYPGRFDRGLWLWQMNRGWEWITVLAVVAGFAIAWWARTHMGRLWSAAVTRKQDHHVVDTGPYRWVRHPIYSGIILAAFATAIRVGSAIAIFGAVLIAVGWFLKARLEENFLRQELGADEYDTYARRTPMLVPFLRFWGRRS